VRSNQDTLESRMLGNLARPVWGWGPGEIPGPTPLFLGSKQAGPRAAILSTILAGAKRHRIEPWAYLREILLRLHAEDPHLDKMLPDRWAAEHPEMVLTYRLEESRQKAARQRDRRRRRRTQRQPK
jgi:transposase